MVDTLLDTDDGSQKASSWTAGLSHEIKYWDDCIASRGGNGARAFRAS
jgi:hypothetical protein